MGNILTENYSQTENKNDILEMDKILRKTLKYYCKKNEDGYIVNDDIESLKKNLLHEIINNHKYNENNETAT